MSGRIRSRLERRFGPKNNLAGVSLVIEWVAFRYINKKLAIFLFSDINSSFIVFKLCLKVLTNLSAKPFVAGRGGADLKCVMPFVFIKFWNLMEVNCCQLSETICSGRPFRANTIRRISIVFIAVILFIGKTSGHLECTSTIVRNCFSSRGTVKSMWILCHCLLGHSHGWMGTFLGLLCASTHLPQRFVICSISLSIAGHHT